MVITAAVRLFVLALTAALSTCHAPQRATTATADPPPPPAPRVFDPDVVRPDPGSALARVREALDQDAAAALELATNAMESANEEDRVALAWVGARAAEKAEVSARAVELFGEIAATDHPLARWARLERARILLDTDAARAAEEVATLAEAAWAGQRTARELQAYALVRAGRGEEAAPLFRALLDEAPGDSPRASVAMPLAELLFAQDAPEAKQDAIALWRRVAFHAPLSRAGRRAEERVRESLAALPAALRAQIGEPPASLGMARAEAIAGAMRHEEAAAAFAELARSIEDPALLCQARLGQARAVYRDRDRDRAAELLTAVADDCDAPDVRAWARYLAGKALAVIDEYDEALVQYGKLEREVPEHRLADDARFRSALIDAELGELTRMTERLSTLPEAYPEGDMHGEARFMLAWRARTEARLDDALSHLEASLREGPGEDAEDIRGRTGYWRACVLSELGRTGEAREGWLAIVRELPLSYYSQQAMVRLGELGPDAAEEARALLGTPGSAEMTFPWRAEFESDAFARAIALFEVGEVDAARDELDWVYDHADAEGEARWWIEAALLDRAGLHPRAVWLTRRRLESFRDQPPTGAQYARWRIAYPAAYAPLIEEIAEARGVPAQLVRAVAREESSFRAEAVSVAHAYGLVQVILPTARQFARRLDLEATPATLTQPEVNLAIGAEYMSWLWDRYESNPAVLPSAYNAGQGATDRWLRERPDQRLDEWIENIPYDETRRYTRRVLQTWGIYTWLARGELPALRAELPPAP